MGRWSMDKILIFNLKWKTLLVLNNAAPIKTNKVKDCIKECGTALLTIPSGLTWTLQPLEIRINKASIESLRTIYAGYWTYNSNIKVSKSANIKWIDGLWYSDSVITNKIIFSSSNIQELVTH